MAKTLTKKELLVTKAKKLKIDSTGTIAELEERIAEAEAEKEEVVEQPESTTEETTEEDAETVDDDETTEETVEEKTEEVEETVEEVVEETVEEIEEPEVPAEEPQQAVPAVKQPGKLYEALANLSSNGKPVAKAGDEIVLSDSLAAYYDKYSPNSIKEIT